MWRSTLVLALRALFALVNVVFKEKKKKESNACVQVKFDVVNKGTNCVVPLEKEYDHFVSPGAGESEYTSESNSS